MMVAGVAGGAGMAAGRLGLVLAVGGLALVSLAYARFAGVELAPATLTVVAPSLRRRPLWTRTMRWTTVLDIRATGTGEIWLALPGEPPLVLRAPRGRWLGRDPNFADKLTLIETWWQVNSAAALRETAHTPYERVQSVLEGRGFEWDWEPPAVARRPPSTARPTAPPFAPSSAPVPARRAGPEGEDDDERTPFPVVALIAFFLLAAGVGYLLIGADIIVLAIALLVLLR